jgi:hypothetical protein
LKLATAKQSELSPLQVGGLVVGGLAYSRCSLPVSPFASRPHQCRDEPRDAIVAVLRRRRPGSTFVKMVEPTGIEPCQGRLKSGPLSPVEMWATCEEVGVVSAG